MVWIYQIVTGVTSVVGVPSTHLVCKMKINLYDIFVQTNSLANSRSVSKIVFLEFNSTPPDKMAAILADGNFKCISLNENDKI